MIEIYMYQKVHLQTTIFLEQNTKTSFFLFESVVLFLFYSVGMTIALDHDVTEKDML